jgi:hypothetical protein
MFACRLSYQLAEGELDTELDGLVLLLDETDVDALGEAELLADTLVETDVLGEFDTELLGEVETDALIEVEALVDTEVLLLVDTDTLGDVLTELDAERLVLGELETDLLILVDGTIGPTHFPSGPITCLSSPFESLTQKPPPVVTHSFCLAIGY